MKISCFTTLTNPTARGDNSQEAIACYKGLADEVIVVDGDKRTKGRPTRYENVKFVYSEWPKEFSWELIGQQFQKGYEACTGDWAIHCDLDFVFHENNYEDIRTALEEAEGEPAMGFLKWQFILPDRYNLKSRLILAVNKKEFGDRIKFNGGGDLCQPTFDGETISVEEAKISRIPFYNYEKLTKTQDQIINDIGRMDRAYQRHFGQWLYSTDGSEESAYEGWYRMVAGRYIKPSAKIELTDHPKVMQELIRNLTPDQFGWSGFGLAERGSYK